MNEKIVFSVVYKNQPIMSVESMKLPFVRGSGELVNLRIRDKNFSQQHLVIIKSGNNVVVRDLSGNKSIVLNGESLSEFVVLDSEVFSVCGDLVCEIGYIIDKENTEVQQTELHDLNQLESTGLDSTNNIAEATKISINPDDEGTQVFELSEEEKTSIVNRAKKAKPKPQQNSLVNVDGTMALSQQKSSIVKLKHSPMLEPYGANPKLQRRRRSLEANLYWKGKLLQSRQLEAGKKLIVGPGLDAQISVPQTRKFREIARLGKRGLKVNVARECECKILKSNEGWGQVMYNPGLNKGYYNLLDNESFVVEYDEHTYLHLRLIPTTRPLTDVKEMDKSLLMWEVFLSSGFVHIVILLLALFLAPSMNDAPKLKNVPKRYAKLLVKKPPPPPVVKPPEPKKEPEPPKPEKKKEIKPKPKPKPKPVVKKKVIRKPKKVIVKKTKKMKKLNKYPLKLKSRTVKPTKVQKVAKDSSKVVAKKVDSMGALGALLSTPKVNTKVASININKNAGGNSKPSKNTTSNLLSSLKTSGGKLPSGGAANRVTTTGAGVGDGSSYGVQGLGGSAGKGAVQGTLGRPDVGSFSKQEGLSRKQVMKVVNKQLTEIQRCYEKALITSQGLAGRVEFEWKISASGKVTSAKVKKAKLKGDGSSLTSCVIKVIKKMKFPKAKNGESTSPNIGFPFGRY